MIKTPKAEKPAKDGRSVSMATKTLAARGTPPRKSAGSGSEAPTVPVVTRIDPQSGALVRFRPYQLDVFRDRTTPIALLEWSRQIGKSFTLAQWAVDRLLTNPGRLVVVLSNSKDNGKEFALKCAEAGRAVQAVVEEQDLSTGEAYEEMQHEVRITVGGKTGRIKVLAANPRTARGFSGDLILDEFAFHQDASAIWDAAEPILSSNKDYLCRIASTHNGVGTLFNRMCRSGSYKVWTVRRSDAWRAGVRIYSSLDRREITPEEARAEALDKASYDQNYECQPMSASGRLLPAELTAAAERDDCGVICEGVWSSAALARIAACTGRLALGFDVARRQHFSVVSVWERLGAERFCRAILRMRNTSLVDQESAVAEAFAAAPGGRIQALVDKTGLGEGPVDHLVRRLGQRVRGIHFSSSMPMTPELATSGERGGTAPAPLVLASRLHLLYLDGVLRHPADRLIRDDLGKPRRVVSEQGRVTIEAEDGPDGHADHFWSFALANWALSDLGAHTFVPVPTRAARGRAERRTRSLF